MSRKIMDRRKKSEKYPWGNPSPIHLDFSLLRALSSVASTFEGSSVPTTEQLETLSSALKEEIEHLANNDVRDPENAVFVPSNNTGFEESKSNMSLGRTRRRSKYNDMDMDTDTVGTSKLNAGDENSDKDRDFINSHKIIDDQSSRDRAKDFFAQLHEHYGPKYQQIVKSFVDSLQRFLRAEISEMALLSILRYLFVDAPEILKKFDDFTQLNVFQALDELNRSGAQMTSTTISNNGNSTNNSSLAFSQALQQQQQQQQLQQGGVGTSSILMEDANKQIMSLLNRPAFTNKASRNSLGPGGIPPMAAANKRSFAEMQASAVAAAAATSSTSGAQNNGNRDDDLDGVKVFIKKIKGCLEPMHYQRVLDLLLELRQSYRNNALVIQSGENMQRLQIIKAILPSNREDLRSQLESYFPIMEAAYTQEEALQESLAMHLNGMTNRFYDRGVGAPMSQNANVLLNSMMTAHRLNASLQQQQQFRGGYGSLPQTRWMGAPGAQTGFDPSSLPFLSRATLGDTGAGNAFLHGDSTTSQLLQQAQLQQQLSLRASQAYASNKSNNNSSSSGVSSAPNSSSSVSSAPVGAAAILGRSSTGVGSLGSIGGGISGIGGGGGSGSSGGIGGTADPVSVLKARLEGVGTSNHLDIYERLSTLDGGRFAAAAAAAAAAGGAPGNQLNLETDSLPPLSATVETELKLRKSLGAVEKVSDPWTDLLGSAASAAAIDREGVNNNSSSINNNNLNINNNSGSNSNSNSNSLSSIGLGILNGSGLSSGGLVARALSGSLKAGSGVIGSKLVGAKATADTASVGGGSSSSSSSESTDKET